LAQIGFLGACLETRREHSRQHESNDNRDRGREHEAQDQATSSTTGRSGPTPSFDSVAGQARSIACRSDRIVQAPACAARPGTGVVRRARGTFTEANLHARDESQMKALSRPSS